MDFGQEWQADDVQVYKGEAAARLIDDEDNRALPVLRLLVELKSAACRGWGKLLAMFA